MIYDKINKSSTFYFPSLSLSVCLPFIFAEFSPIYESIHFDATLAAQHANTIRRNQIKSIERCTVFEPIGNDKTCAAAPSPNRNNERDVRDCFERCIPPPPITSPPHDSDDSDTDHDPVQINEQTLEKLNSLYSLYKFRQSTGNEIDEVEDVVLRLRKFNDCTSRPFRGSSKAMCSFVSVTINIRYISISLCHWNNFFYYCISFAVISFAFSASLSYCFFYSSILIHFFFLFLLLFLFRCFFFLFLVCAEC